MDRTNELGTMEAFKESAGKTLDTAIHRLMEDFVCQPYLHRCEHSLHCELYARLIASKIFQGLYPLKGARYRTGLIHKEWPETTPVKGHRRGNFDLVVLDPIKTVEYDDRGLRNGSIPPLFVVELGLNYSHSHLQRDLAKLKNSHHLNGGYLIHLAHPNTKISDKERGRLREWRPTAEVKIATVLYIEGKAKIKELSLPWRDFINNAGI